MAIATNPLLTTSTYNSLGQLLTLTTPDAGTVKNVYRLNGQIRFSQNAQQTVEKKYSYVNYDFYNRVIESGEYAYTDNAADAFALYMNPELALNINSCSQRNFMA